MVKRLGVVVVIDTLQDNGDVTPEVIRADFIAAIIIRPAGKMCFHGLHDKQGGVEREIPTHLEIITSIPIGFAPADGPGMPTLPLGFRVMRTFDKIDDVLECYATAMDHWLSLKKL